MIEKIHLNRVAIIGCDHIAPTNAYSLLRSGVVEELVLIDKDADYLLSEVMTLLRAVPLPGAFKTWVGSYADVVEADIVVIAAGVESLPGEYRLDLLDRNVAVIREIARELKAVNFDGIILMTTNPVDVLAQVAQEESCLPAKKVIGSGTVLNMPRGRQTYGAVSGVEAGSINAPISIEQGNSEVATWCAALIGGQPLVDFCRPNCPDFGKMLRRVHDTAPVIIERKSYTSFPIGSCVTKICEAILRDEQTILPVCTMANGQYGIEGVYLSLPCVVGRNGVERIVEAPLDEAERERLRVSADLLKNALGELKKIE